VSGSPLLAPAAHGRRCSVSAPGGGVVTNNALQVAHRVPVGGDFMAQTPGAGPPRGLDELVHHPE
jgi:hypothetical protein